MTGWQQALTVGGVVLAGTNAGVFFVFSSFVIRGLSALPNQNGAAAMQEINRFAPNPAFMLTFFGAAMIGTPLLTQLGGLDQPSTRWLLAAIVLSAITVVITAAFHVPRNNVLDSLDAGSATTAEYWQNYVVVWTRGNHVRTLTSAASAACYALVLRG